MTDQHPDYSPEPNRGNRKGEFYPDKQAKAMEWDVAKPAPFAPLGDSGIAAEQESSISDGEWAKFPQPRGWSLQWDGSSISAIQEFNTRQTPPTAHKTRTDGSAPPSTQD